MCISKPRRNAEFQRGFLVLISHFLGNMLQKTRRILYLQIEDAVNIMKLLRINGTFVIYQDG